MRVLFSADWHLGYEMGGANRVERLPDQRRQMDLIARYIEENDVDVLAICGDVFEAQERGRARAAVSAMMTAFGPALERGLTILMIAGNHDRDYFMETANEWLGASRVGSGRGIILATRPEVITLEKRGEKVNFVVMPFPTPTRYGISDPNYSGGAAASNERIVAQYLDTLDALKEQYAPMHLPTVLMTHCTVEGTEVGPHRISPRDDIVVPRSRLPSVELTVIGHIHKPEQLSDRLYYVGALDRFDMGEAYYEPRVLIADIGPSGLRGDPLSLELDATPFEDVYIETEDDLQRRFDGMRDPQQALVKLTITVPYGTYTAPLIARARELFPRLYGNVQHEWLGAPVVAPSVAGLNITDVSGTIHRYLTEQVADESERAELLELVEELRVAAGQQASWPGGTAPTAAAPPATAEEAPP